MRGANRAHGERASSIAATPLDRSQRQQLLGTEGAAVDVDLPIEPVRAADSSQLDEPQSVISSVTRRSMRDEAAPSTRRSAFAVRPSRPITWPMSS